MAGRNQHNIPQFLQRAFGVTSGKKAEKIWEFRQSTSPQLVTIENTGSGFDFYSSPGEQLDDQITAVEKKIFKLYARLAQSPAGSPVDSQWAASVVAHLAPRTAHIRSMFADGVTSALGMMSRMTKPDFLMRYLGLDVDYVNETFEKHVAPILEEAGLLVPGVPRHAILEMAFLHTRASPGDILATTGTHIAASIDAMIERTPSEARRGHNRAIGNLLDRDVRKEELLGFHWEIIDAPSIGAILPDCIAITYNGKGHAEPYIAAGLGTDQVLMPLHRKRLLVGRKHAQSSVNCYAFNADAAKCSHSFFLAANDSGEFKELTSLIGQYFDGKFEEIASEVLQDLAPPLVHTPLLSSTAQALTKSKRVVGRNDTCPCGSGKKYKKCCYEER